MKTIKEFLKVLEESTVNEESAVEDTVTVKYGMIRIIKDGNRYTLSKESRDGNTAYTYTESFTKNDLINMKKAIDEILANKED